MAARALAGRLPAAARFQSPVGLAAAVAGLAVLSALGFQIVRKALGVAFASDAYSYLVWARRALREGELGHVPSDFTVPKPLELLLASTGEVLGAPVAFFGAWAVFSHLAALLAAAALAGRLRGRAAAGLAAVLALVLPGLFLQGLAADATVPYAACVVGAAALSPLRAAPASGLLGLAGLLRPEAWGLAALHALLTWRRSGARERVVAVASAVVPPAAWLTFDFVATGDALYGSHAVDRFGVVAVPAGDVPSALVRVVPDVAGWPLVVLALVAFAGGLLRRPLDPAVVFPAALAAGLLAELLLGLISAESLRKYSLGLALFLPVGAGVALASVPGRARLPAAVAGVALCLWAVADRIQEVRDIHEQRAAGAAELESGMGAAARAAVADGALLAGERQWLGATSFYGDVARDRVVPLDAVGRTTDAARVGAYLVLVRRQALRESRGSIVLAGLELARASPTWRLYSPSPASGYWRESPPGAPGSARPLS